MTEEFPPFNYRDGTGQITGPVTRVVEEILNRTGEITPIELLLWSEGYKICQDVPGTVLFSMSRSQEREGHFQWVGPVASFEFVFYGRNESHQKISTLDDARKVSTIAVVRDDVRHQFLAENNLTNLLLCSDDHECVARLLSHEADLWLGSSAGAAWVLEEAGADPHAIVPLYPVRTIEIYIALQRETPVETVQVWRDTLAAMQRDGTVARIRDEFGVPLISREDEGNYNCSGDFAYQDQTLLSAILALTDAKVLLCARPLEAFALTSDAGSGEWETIRPILTAVERQAPYGRFWYAHPNGSYYTTVDGPATSNLYDRPYFAGVISGNESIGTIVVSHSTGKGTAIVAVPIVRNGTVTGVLGASLYLDQISEYLRESVDLPEGTEFFAIGQEGLVALHSRPEKILQDIGRRDLDAPEGPTVARMIEEKGGSFEYTSPEGSWRGSFARSELTGWSFAVQHQS
jgi:ABC-type amino acid transport substrate-binding protein